MFTSKYEGTINKRSNNLKPKVAKEMLCSFKVDCFISFGWNYYQFSDNIIAWCES